MDFCKGFSDWFECLQCPHLCTKLCPIESEDVIEAMEKRMRIFSVPKADGERKYFKEKE